MEDRTKTKKRWIEKPAFTLIELLVVISIIALLLSILMPALSKVKEQARLVVCRTNMHQWGIAAFTWGQDREGRPPLSTTYLVADRKVIASFPNEMYLDTHAGHLPITGDAEEDAKWEEMMISHESFSSYLPGFNDKGLRTTDMPFNERENFKLEGVWNCPSHNKQDIELTLGMLNGQHGGNRSFFRTNYAYFGRSDLWSEVMFPVDRDRQTLAGKEPSSREIMLSDPIFYWPNGEIYLYNHGKMGCSEFGFTGNDDTVPPEEITGINQAYGDGRVEWKKIGSDERFQKYGFGSTSTSKNRYLELGYTAQLFY